MTRFDTENKDVAGGGVSQNVAKCRTCKEILAAHGAARPGVSQNVPKCSPRKRILDSRTAHTRPPAVTFRATTGPQPGVHWQRLRGPAMTRPPLPALVRRALARHALADTPDRELLCRFAAHRDADAFTELVERYAPLVWGACRRVLGPGESAEDAFQATFVTLASKAGSIRRPERLPGW